MTNYNWFIKFDDGTGFEVAAHDAVGAACAAVKLHNKTAVEYDDAGGRLAAVNYISSRNILSIERRAICA